ncbi:hypothetical protein LEMLEM_LOCUS989 [Lemmus lemmus]
MSQVMVACGDCVPSSRFKSSRPDSAAKSAGLCV